MTCQPFDEVMYHGEICHVEQVWESGGIRWAILRPASQAAIHTEGGVYIVDQDDVYRVPSQGAAA